MVSFFKHHDLKLEAGHAMLLVGYNDEYQTETGMKGGFIVRNTWMDGVWALDEFGHVKSRGSHSIAYFMQTISASNEHFLCPNNYNPRNWYACSGVDKWNDLNAVATICTNQNNVATAAAQYQPYFLNCRNITNCFAPDTVNFVLINATRYGDDLTIMCFLRLDTIVSTWCGPPIPLDSYTAYFAPAPSPSLRENDDDWCGFYFIPYDLIRESNALFGSFFVNDYHFTFTPSSFMAAQDKNLDYSYIKSSTLNQKPVPNFDTPYPNT